MRAFWRIAVPRLLDLAASRKLSTVLIGALAVACFAVGAHGGFFSAWGMAGLVALLGLNTLACCLKLGRAVRGSEFVMESRVEDAGPARQRAAELLSSLGYHLRPGKNGADVQGTRGLPARWALVAFHLGLVALMALTGLHVLMRSERILFAASGFFFEDRPEYYAVVRDGPLAPGFGRFYGRVTRVWTHDGGDHCEITVLDRGPGGKAGLALSRSRPVSVWGTTLRLLETGPAPVVTLRRDGEVLMESCVNLYAGSRGQPAMDQVAVPGHGLTLRIAPRGESFHVALAKGDRHVLEGSLRPGERVQGGGYELGMPEVRRWAKVAILREPLAVPIAIGLGASVLALAAYAMMYRRTISVAVEKQGTVRLRGRSERFSPLFREEMACVLEGITDRRDVP